MLKVIACEIYNCLKQIFNNSLVLGHYLLYFKEFVIIILRKIGDNQDCNSLKS